MRILRVCAASVVFLAVIPGPASAQGGEGSYEFLLRKGQLLADYGKFDEASDVLFSACSLPTGKLEPRCWAQLADVAHRSGKIGLAIDAWTEATRRAQGELLSIAQGELERIQRTFGTARALAASGRTLPSRPGRLRSEVPLLDPLLKSQLARLNTVLQQSGWGEEALWLPVGTYRFSGVSFEVKPSQTTTFSLPLRAVPYRPETFALKGTQRPGLGGPWELGVDGGVALAGIPGGVVGVNPVGGTLRLRLARILGALRLEGALGTTLMASASESFPGDSDREGLAAGTWLDLDVGVLMALGPRVILLPHAGGRVGSFGRLLVPCLAGQTGTQIVHSGECSVPTVGGGGQFGVDLNLLPAELLGRLSLRIGVNLQVLGGRLGAVPNQKLQGSLAAELVSLDATEFLWVGGGLHVGASLHL